MKGLNLVVYPTVCCKLTSLNKLPCKNCVFASFSIFNKVLFTFAQTDRKVFSVACKRLMNYPPRRLFYADITRLSAARIEVSHVCACTYRGVSAVD